jgi:hypothetical protein
VDGIALRQNFNYFALQRVRCSAGFGSLATIAAIRHASSRVRRCVFTPDATSFSSIKSRKNYCAGNHEG